MRKSHSKAILCLCGVFFLLIPSAFSQDGPLTPRKVYAFAGSTVELPCITAPGEYVEWSAEHEDESLQSRSTLVTDDDLNNRVIESVRATDAGVFTCTSKSGSSSVQLIVIDELFPPQNIHIRMTSNDEVNVFWNPPKRNHEHVAGYRLYVTEVGREARQANFTLLDLSSNGNESFILMDLSPNSAYEIEIAALYPEGADDLKEFREGPRSKKLIVETPSFDSPPTRLTLTPSANSTILVSWRPPSNVDAKYISGYKLYIKSVGRKKVPPKVLTYNAPNPEGKWRFTIGDLPLKNRYNFEVAAITQSGKDIKVGKKSAPVTYRHDGFLPEISLNAIPLDPETVMLILKTVGFGKVDKVRLLYSDDSATKWNRVKTYKPKEGYAIVTGLQPRSIYFFMAKARIDRKARQVVTHAMTPPSGLSAPYNVTVSAQSDNSVSITWNHSGLKPKGYIVKVERQLENGQFSPDKQKVVYENEAVVGGLYDDEKYQVKVIPFDLSGPSTTSEPVVFHIAASETEITTKAPLREKPRIIQEPPETLQISAGDDVKLSCSAIGQPHPTVTWFRDGAKIGESGDRTNELFLQGVQQDTLLMCMASNDLGSDMRATRVDVSQGIDLPPKFLENQEETMMVEGGGTIAIPCSAEGNPPPTIEWYKDGVLLPELKNSNNFVEREVKKAFTVICRAENKFGFITRETKVLVKDYLVPPKLVKEESSASVIEVDPMEGINLTCTFTGNPSPSVTFYSDGIPLSSSSVSRNSVILESVNRSSIFECRAYNAAGDETYQMNVNVLAKPKETTTNYLVPPKLVREESSASVIEVYPMEAINLTCTFTGNPLPSVVFYRNGFPVPGSYYVSRNSVILESVNRSSIFECRAYNAAGDETYQMNVYVLAKPKETTTTQTPQRDSGYTLNAENIPVSENQVEVRWSVDRGDLEKIRAFDVTLISPSGNVLMRQRLGPDQRYLLLSRLSPGRSYTLNLKTLTNSGVVHNETRTVIARDVDKSRMPRMDTSVVEVRPSSARINFATLDPDDSYRYRLRLQHLDLGGITLFDQDYPADSPSLKIEKLDPNRRYRVLVDAIPQMAGKPALTSQMDFLTPPQGNYGTPVKSPWSGDQTKIEESQTTTVRDIIWTRTTTLPPTPVPVQDDGSYKLNLRTPNRTPYQVFIRWSVDRGDLEKIDNFVVTIKRDTGRTLLEQALKANQRSVTIQSLRPNTRYDIELKAKGKDGEILAEEDLPFITASEDTTAVQAPVLDLEANEIRPTRARLDWLVVNSQPGDVTSYRLTVRDEGPNGPKLLQQVYSVNSHSLDLQNLSPNKRYHATIDAVGPDGKNLLTASLPFHTPAEGNYGLPQRSSSGFDERVDRSRPTNPSVPQEPKLDMEISQVGRDSARLTWEVSGEPRPVASYNVKVKANGAGGQTLLERDMPADTVLFNMQLLQPGQTYYVEMSALDSNSQPMLRVAHHYRLGTPPIRISSTNHVNDNSRRSSDSSNSNVDVKSTILKPDMGEPSLELDIQETGGDTARLAWQVTGDSRPVSGYKLKVKANGPEGQTLLQRDMTPDTGYFDLKQLTPGQTYYLELDALDSSSRPMLSVNNLYRLGTAPVHVSSNDDNNNNYRESSSSSNNENPWSSSRMPDMGEPSLELDIQETGGDTARLAWQVTGDSRPVSGYKLKVKANGPEGQTLLQRDMTPDTGYFDLKQLTLGQTYYLELDALDSSSRPMLSVNNLYRLGTAPVHVSSNDDNNNNYRESSSSSNNENPWSSSRMPDMGESSLELDIQETGGDTARLAWQVTGDSRPVSGYKLKVKANGPEGQTLLQRDITPNIDYFDLKQLTPGQTYYLELDALDSSSRPMLSVNNLYRLGTAPVHVSSNDDNNNNNRESSSSSNNENPWSSSRKPDMGEPSLELDIQQTGGDTATLTWQVTGDSRPVSGYKLKVKANGPEGQTLLQRDMTPNIRYFDLKQLTPGQTYYLELDALDSSSRPMLSVNNLYRLGTAPVHVSSNDDNNNNNRESSSSSNNENPWSSSRKPEEGVPTLDLEVRPVKGTSASLTWKLKGDDSPLAKYKVTVRRNGPTGYVLMEDDLNAFINQFQVDQLQRGELYYFQVDALANNNVPFVTVGAAFVVPPPDSSPQPIKVSSTGSRAPPTEADSGRPQIHEPILGITITPQGTSSAKLTWEIAGPGHSAVFYRVKVFDIDQSQQLLETPPAPLSETHFTIDGLQPRKKYYIQLQALASNLQPLLTAGAEYRPPGTGRQSQPTRGSSVTTDQSGAPPPPREIFTPPPPPTTRLPASRDLQVTEARAMGSSGLFVKWRAMDEAPYTDATMLRLAKMLPGNKREKFVIHFIPSGTTDTVLTGLEPNQIYGLQVGSRTSQTQGQYIRWSDMRLVRTGNQ